MILNVTTVFLLSLLLLGIYTMPKFNYSLLVLQQKTLEEKQRTLETRFEKINVFAGDENKRAAVLNALDGIPQLLNEIKDLLSNLSEDTLESSAKVNHLDRRLKILEEKVNSNSAIDPEYLLTFKEISDLFEQSYTAQVNLPEALKKKADYFSPQGTAEGDFYKFLETAMNSKLVLNEKPDQIPESQVRYLLKAFSIFKCNIDLINRDEHLHVMELAEESNTKGNYLELPMQASVEELENASTIDKGMLFIKNIDNLGVKRYFRFSYDDYPEFTQFHTLRNNARDHLIRDAALITGNLETSSK